MFRRRVSACSWLGCLRRLGGLVVVILLHFGAGDLAAVDARHYVFAILLAGTAQARQQRDQGHRQSGHHGETRHILAFRFQTPLLPKTTCSRETLGKAGFRGQRSCRRKPLRTSARARTRTAQGRAFTILSLPRRCSMPNSHPICWSPAAMLELTPGRWLHACGQQLLVQGGPALARRPSRLPAARPLTNIVGVALTPTESPSAIDAFTAASDCAFTQACSRVASSAILLAEVQRQPVQFTERLLRVLLRATDRALIGVQVVGKLPVALPLSLARQLASLAACCAQGCIEYSG